MNAVLDPTAPGVPAMETSFRPRANLEAERRFSQVNPLVGVRGTFEEGFAGRSQVGVFVDGVEDQATGASTLVQAADFFQVSLTVGGERLNFAWSRVADYRRFLDPQNGVLTRSFVWQTAGRHLELRFDRLLSWDEPLLAYQRVCLRALDFSGAVEVATGVDFAREHEAFVPNHWHCNTPADLSGGAALEGRTKVSGCRLEAAFRVEVDGRVVPSAFETGKKYAGRRWVIPLEPGTTTTLEKTTALALGGRAAAGLADRRALSFAAAVEANRRVGPPVGLPDRVVRALDAPWTGDFRRLSRVIWPA